MPAARGTYTTAVGILRGRLDNVCTVLSVRVCLTLEPMVRGAPTTPMLRVHCIVMRGYINIPPPYIAVRCWSWVSFAKIKKRVPHREVRRIHAELRAFALGMKRGGLCSAYTIGYKVYAEYKYIRPRNRYSRPRAIEE